MTNYHNPTDAPYDDADVNPYMGETDDMRDIAHPSEQEEREAREAWEAEQEQE